MVERIVALRPKEDLDVLSPDVGRAGGLLVTRLVVLEVEVVAVMREPQRPAFVKSTFKASPSADGQNGTNDPRTGIFASDSRFA